MCMNMCISESTRVSCTFSLALFFVCLFILSYFSFLLFYFIFWIPVCFLKRERESDVDLDRRKVGRIWR